MNTIYIINILCIILITQINLLTQFNILKENSKKHSKFKIIRKQKII